MSPRLSKVVTRSGDDGTTGLGDGTRVPKDCARIEAMGTVDELNSALGVLLAQPLPGAPPATATLPARDWLLEIQQRLFDLGGELAVPGLSIIEEAAVGRLESRIGQLNAQLPPLREFVLPGGGPAAAACHLARTICRRAERRCWTLVREAAAARPPAASSKARPAPKAGAVAAAAVSGISLRFLNRLSDFLFVLARLYARASGSGEALWQHERHVGREPGRE
jgi:cob(I)alamin adenosyltransferase